LRKDACTRPPGQQANGSAAVAQILLLSVLWLFPSVCLGQTKCPWMSEATARGVLGGPLTLKANIHEHGDGVCEFSRKEGAAIHELRISVELMTDIPKQFPNVRSQCPPNSTSLHAIGNEALMCSVEEKGLHTEKVVGRVREQAFVVSVSSSVRDDPSMTLDMRREKVHLVAEGVAGMLF
jgi:hypothetical protein